MGVQLELVFFLRSPSHLPVDDEPTAEHQEEDQGGSDPATGRGFESARTEPKSRSAGRPRSALSGVCLPFEGVVDGPMGVGV